MKLNKILLIIFLLVVILLCLGTTTKATGDIMDANTIANPLGNVQITDDNVILFVAKIINIIKIFSILAAVISLIIIGIQYMMGSVEQKAVDKKKINTLLIGILFMSSIMAIASFIFESFAQIAGI